MAKKFVIWRHSMKDGWEQVSHPMERLAAYSDAQDRQDIATSAGRDYYYQVALDGEGPPSS